MLHEIVIARADPNVMPDDTTAPLYILASLRLSDIFTWQHTRQDLNAKILFASQAVRTTLDNTDFVVQTLDETEGHLGHSGADTLARTSHRASIP
jgi:hypothetical protein